MYFDTLATTDGNYIALGSEIVTYDATNQTRAGFVFDGWYSDSSLSAIFDFDAVPTESVTVYAKWSVIKNNTYEDELPETGINKNLIPDILMIVGSMLLVINKAKKQRIRHKK